MIASVTLIIAILGYVIGEENRNYGVRNKDIPGGDYEGYGRPTFRLNTGEGNNYEEKQPFIGQSQALDFNLKDDGDIGYENYENRGAYGNQMYRGNQGEYYDEETKRRMDKIFGYTGTDFDQPENLVRPCALDDWQCIRKYFAANGECKPAYGPIPDPMVIDANTVTFSSTNLTLVLADFMARGLSSGKVNDFYVNKKTGNLVFAVDFQNLNLSSPRAYARFRRTAKESLILADAVFVFFQSVTFTAVIPKVPKLRLDYADVHAYTPNAFPVFYFGPGIVASSDPDVTNALAQFLLLIPIDVQEGLFLISQILMAIFTQSNICDFGLRLISN